MTRRRFYAPPESFSLDRAIVTLGGEETRHLRDVLRLRSGDKIHVFDGAGNEFHCEVQKISRDSTEARVIDQVSPACPESPLDLTLALALLKGEKFDLVVQKATELGVTRIVPIVTTRADVKLKGDNDADRKHSRWQRIALEAAKQCGRARLIEIERPLTVFELIEAPNGASDFRWMFAERGGASLDQTLQDSSGTPGKLTAVVGSEGGWTGEEIAQAFDAGWKIVTLGGRILRAETAGIVIAAVLQHRFGDLR